MTVEKLTRRSAVRGVTIAGVGVPLLAACGADEEVAQSTEDETKATPQDESTSEGGGSVAALATTADIPVNGGKVFESEKVVIVQSTEGEFKAYSAVCPHQQCVFTDVADNTIKCGGCHKAEFGSADGANTVGPNGGEATLPALEEVALKVDGDSISLA